MMFDSRGYGLAEQSSSGVLGLGVKAVGLEMFEKGV